MNKIFLENEFNVQRLDHLKKFGYPECDITPLTANQIKNLKIGTACYVVPLQSSLKLSMFTGYYSDTDIFSFDNYTGTHRYKPQNVGKTYNVFLANMNEE